MRVKRTGCTVLRLVVLAILVVTIENSSAQRVAEFCYRGTPELLNGRTIHVSDTMVSLSYILIARDSIKDSSITTTDTPSIFFVIAHSPSMSYLNPAGPVNDQWGNRFKIASALIDSIYMYYPSAQIGLALYDGSFYLRPQDDTLFDTCPAPNNQGGYLPLLNLSSSYETGTGRSILKHYLEMDTIDAPPGSNPEVTQYAELKYHPRTRASSNITIGFEAAKNAMLLSLHKLSVNKIIFLTDGSADRGGDAWIAGVNVPTTYTIYFTNTSALITNLQTMTTNIQNNLYSYSNPSSAAWPFNNTVFNSLMSFIMSNIYERIEIDRQQTPTQITVNGQTVNTRSGDSAFILNEMIPLTGQNTPVYIQLHNVIRWRGGNLDTIIDTIHNINYSIQTLPHLSTAWNPQRDSFDIWTWDRTLSFHYAVGATDTPISYIAQTMDSVELYFTFDSGTAHYGYDGAPGLGLPVDIYNKTPYATGYTNDHEIIYLSRVVGNIFSAKFKRQASVLANPGDGVLQYQGNSDSIVAVFRNNESDKTVLPLDTLRVAIALSPPSGVAYDNKAKQYADKMWSVFSDNGRIRVRFPDNSAHAVKIFSLAGHCVDSRLTSESDVLFRLPRGAYIVTAETAGNGPHMTKKIFNVK